MWMIVPGMVYYLWLGLGLLAYHVGFAVSALYCNLNHIDLLDPGPAHPEIVQIHEGTLCVFWAILLTWALGMVEREPKDMKIFAMTFIYGTMFATAAMLAIGVYVVYRSTQ